MSSQRQADRAVFEINERIKSKIVDNNNLFLDHRIDHKHNLLQINKVKVVFGEKASKKLFSIISKVIDTDLTEHGTYFYGKIVDNILYIDEYKSDFIHSDGIYKDGAVDVTQRNIDELNLMINKTEENKNPYNVVMHFHTHPDYMYDKEGNIVEPKSDFFSDNDYYSLAYQQKYLQPNNGDFVFFLGGLVVKNKNNPQINCIYYDVDKKNFFNILNIYYIHNGIVNKFNNDNILDEKDFSIQEALSIIKKIKKYKFENK